MLRVHVLGGLRVDGLADARLGSRKGRRLLGALAVAAPAAVSVDSLVEVLWPEGPPSRPAEQVGVLVSRLRAALGRERIVRRDAGWSLACDWTDVQELATRAVEASDALDAGRLRAARASAEAALALGQPVVLPEEDGAWVEAARARARADVAAARRVLVEAAVAAGDLATAVVHAEAILALDPLDEAVVRALMVAHVRSGRPAAALAAYARLRADLAEELGVSPSEEVESLHTAIVRGEVDHRPGAGRAEAAVVGRDRELEALDGFLRDPGTTVVVEGEPGIGKTTLLDAWAGRIDDDEALVLRGRGDPLGRDLPLQPVADALHRAVQLAPDVLDGLTADDRRLLSTSLGIGAEDDDGRAAPGRGSGPARLYAAIDHLLDIAARGRTVVIVLDDLHHADAATSSWIAHVVRRHPRLLVVAARHVATAPLPGAAVVRLGPLDRDAVARLVGEDRAGELHARSGGHPLLLQALAGARDGDMPLDLRDAVDRQLAALGDGAGVVRHAAVLGPEVDLDLLAGVEASPAADVLTVLERAVAAGLLDGDRGRLRFRHELVREALESQVSTPRRAVVHADAARRLARRSQPDWAAVAYHAHAGGDDELAADAHRRAAAASAARYDLSAAEAHLDRAIALEPYAGALLERARIRLSRVDLDGAGSDAAAAVAAGGGAPAHEVAAWVAYYQRRYEEAAARADEALALAPDETVRVGALAVAARVRHGAGDLSGALDLLDSPRAGPPPVRGVADVWHAHLLVHAGDPAGALRLADRALAAGDGLAQPFAPLHGRFARVMALGQLGRPRDALAACDDLDAAVARFGEQALRFQGPAANVRGWVLRNLGYLDVAREANELALAATGDAGAPRAAALAEGFWVAMLDLADGALVGESWDDAAALLDRCGPIEQWDGTMAWHQRHRLALQRARLALAVGDRDGARELAAEVAADAEARGAERYRLLAQAVRAAADPDVDATEVVDRLHHVAGLEAWRHVAAIATARGDDGLRRQAERQATALVRAAGDHGSALAELARRLLSR